MLCNLLHHRLLRRIEQRDGHTLAAEAATAADTVDVALLVGEAGDVEVEHELHLLNINSTRQQVRGNENAGSTIAELLHALLTLGLGHGFTVDYGHREAATRELPVNPLGALLRVHEDDGLWDSERLIDIQEGGELPGILIKRHHVLLDTIQLDIRCAEGDAHRVAENLVGELLDLRGHRGREERDLTGGRETDVHNLVDLVGEAVTEHLIGLIEDEHAEVVELEVTARGQVPDATRGTNDDVCRAHLTGVLVAGNTADREHDIDAHVGRKAANNIANL